MGGACWPMGASLARCSLIWYGLFSALPALFGAEAFSVLFQNMDVMGQPVEQCTCEALRSKGAGPFIERQVGGDDDRAPFIALGDGLEQQYGAGL